MKRFRVKYKIICCLLIFSSCEPNCQYFKNKFRKEYFNFRITKKDHDGIFLILEGMNEKKVKEKFEHAGFSDLDKDAEINDIMKKDSGSIKILLIKKDTVLSYEWWCREDSMKVPLSSAASSNTEHR